MNTIATGRIWKSIFLSYFVLFSTKRAEARTGVVAKAEIPKGYPVRFRTVKAGGLNIFYREAGNPQKPTILLLHGFPTSSFMYRDLINDLAADFHLVAPDYPGSGLSDHPSPETYSYTFDQLSETMEKFVDALGIKKFSLYMQDFGGPVGFRLIGRRPELLQTLIVQNANAYEDGLGPLLQNVIALVKANDTAGLDKELRRQTSYEGIREQYLDGAHSAEGVAPDGYTLDNALMQSGRNREIQLALLNDYGTNFPLYPAWHRYLREHQPPTLILWGGNDRIFTTPGGTAYLRDVNKAEIHIFDGGHFMLEEFHREAAGYIRTFVGKNAK